MCFNNHRDWRLRRDPANTKGSHHHLQRFKTDMLPFANEVSLFLLSTASTMCSYDTRSKTESDWLPLRDSETRLNQLRALPTPAIAYTRGASKASASTQNSADVQQIDRGHSDLPLDEARSLQTCPIFCDMSSGFAGFELVISAHFSINAGWEFAISARLSVDVYGI